jgi:hypothetical protein
VQIPCAAAKAGLAGLTRSVARAVARKGITVNCVILGSIETELPLTLRYTSRDRVPRGVAGIGKTALLRWAATRADDMLVIWVAGVESEMDLAFAGIHQLLAPILDRPERLPVPQREALRSAFGLLVGSPPDRLLVGLAALTLITDAAVKRPLLCVIDDAQWLDHASIQLLGFVAGRLLADQVGMLLGVRDGEQRAAMFEGLPELRLSD